MKDYFADILYGIAVSKRTQWALFLGVFFFVGITLVGSYLTSNLHFSGPFKAMEEVMAHKLLKKYDKAAWFALISFWILAYRCYHKDKKRFW